MGVNTLVKSSNPYCSRTILSMRLQLPTRPTRMRLQREPGGQFLIWLGVCWLMQNCPNSSGRMLSWHQLIYATGVTTRGLGKLPMNVWQVLNLICPTRMYLVQCVMHMCKTQPNWIQELRKVFLWGMTGLALHFLCIAHKQKLSGKCDVSSSLRILTMLMKLLNCCLILLNQGNLKYQPMEMRMPMLGVNLLEITLDQSILMTM